MVKLTKLTVLLGRTNDAGSKTIGHNVIGEIFRAIFSKTGLFFTQ